MGRNVDGARNGRGCVPDRVYLGVSDWEDGVMDIKILMTGIVLFFVGSFMIKIDDDEGPIFLSGAFISLGGLVAAVVAGLLAIWTRLP